MDEIEWTPETAEARRRKLHRLAKRIGMDRDDRHAYAGMLLCRDIDTWKGLPDSDVVRLLDGFDGYLLLTELARQKVPHGCVA